MNALEQKKLESMFCPIIDPAVVAFLIEDNPDFDICFDKLSILAKEACRVLESERESESSENGSGSVHETGDGSVTSLDCHMDRLGFGDEFDVDEEIEGNNFYSEGKLTVESFEEFLKGCFPTLSEAEIRSSIRENDDAEIILEKLLEVQQKESAYSFTSPSASTSFTVKGNYDDDDDNLLVSESRSKHRKKKRYRKQIQVNSSSLSDFNSSTSSSLTSKEPPLPLWDKRWPPPESRTSQSWDDQWPPLPSSNSLGKKVHPSISRDNNPDPNKQHESIERLSEIFPDHDTQTLRAALKAANGVVEIATEMLLGDEVRSNEPPQIHHSPFLPNGVGFNVETGEYKIIQQKKNRSPIRPQSTFSLNHVSSSASFTRNENVSDDESFSDYEPKYCRQKANEYREMRDDAFRKALKAWRNSRNSRSGDGGIASYYSTEGREYDKEMKKWNLRAVRSMVQQKSKADDDILDLHKLTVSEALMVVREKLRIWYYSKGKTKSGYTSSLRPLKIITGVGKHSINGVAKLPDAIDQFLCRDNWDFSKHEGYVVVKGPKNH